MSTESQGKWTPGPWSVGKTVTGKVWIYAKDGGRVGKAASDRKGAERVANERLIASAPTLHAEHARNVRVLSEALRALADSRAWDEDPADARENLRLLLAEALRNSQRGTASVEG